MPTQEPHPHAPLPSGGLAPQEAASGSAPQATPVLSSAGEPSTVAQVVTDTGLREVQFGSYTIVRELARGAMGVVYQVHDKRLDRHVALKLIRGGVLAESENIQRFTREARAVAQLRHPHIVPIYEVGQCAGEHYFTMELAPSGSLNSHRARFQENRHEAVVLLIKIANALQHVHDHGMLHRDLKPGNILLRAADEPMISDFGLAKSVGNDPDLTQTGAAVGTPAYMAPEQATGQLTRFGPATDIWSLGVIAYELLCGNRPFSGTDSRRLEDAIVNDPPSSPRRLRKDLPRDLEVILLKALEKDPSRRYTSAGAFANDLEAWLGGRPIKARPIGKFSRLVRWTRKQSALVGVALVGAMVALAFFLTRPATRVGHEAESALALKKIESDLLEGRPVKLLGPIGSPLYSRWIAPGVATHAPDAPLKLSAKSHAMFLLLPDSHVSRYRLAAEILAEENVVSSGLFVCHSSHETATGPLHAQCIARLNPKWASAFLELSHYVPNAKGTSYRGLQAGELIPIARAPGEWRRLALDVGPEFIGIELDGAQIVKLPAKTRVDYANRMLFGRPDVLGEAHPVFAPRGGVGLFLENGTVSFRNVTLTPLAAPQP